MTSAWFSEDDLDELAHYIHRVFEAVHGDVGHARPAALYNDLENDVERFDVPEMHVYTEILGEAPYTADNKDRLEATVRDRVEAYARTPFDDATTDTIVDTVVDDVLDTAGPGQEQYIDAAVSSAVKQEESDRY